MAIQQTKIKNSNPGQKTPVPGVNDCGTIKVEAHIKIFDPNTQKTFVEGRA